jgi:hypothetical protein
MSQSTNAFGVASSTLILMVIILSDQLAAVNADYWCEATTILINPAWKSLCPDYQGCDTWSGACIANGCQNSVDCARNPTNKKCDTYDVACGLAGCCVAVCSERAAETSGVCQECLGSGAECGWSGWRRCDRWSRYVPTSGITKNICRDSCYDDDLVYYDNNAGLYFVGGQTTPTTCDIPIVDSSCNVYELAHISVTKATELNLTFAIEGSKIFNPVDLSGKHLDPITMWPFGATDYITRFERGSKFHWPGDNLPDYCTYRCPDGAALGIWDMSYMCTECSTTWGLDCLNRHDVYGDGQQICDSFTRLLNQDDKYMNWFVNASNYAERIKFKHFPDMFFEPEQPSYNWTYPTHGKNVCGYGCHPYSAYNSIRITCFECADDLGCSWCGADEWACEQQPTLSYHTCTKVLCSLLQTPAYPHPYLPNSPGLNPLFALLLKQNVPDLIANITDRVVSVNGTTYKTISSTQLEEAERFFNDTIKPAYTNGVALWLLRNPYFANVLRASRSSVNVQSVSSSPNQHSGRRRISPALSCQTYKSAGIPSKLDKSELEYRQFISDNIRNINSYQYTDPDAYANAVVLELYKILMMEIRHPKLSSSILSAFEFGDRLDDKSISSMLTPFGIRIRNYTDIEQHEHKAAIDAHITELRHTAKIVDGKYFRNKINAVGLARSLQQKYYRPLLPGQTRLRAAVFDESFRRRVLNLMSSLPNSSTK